MSTWILLTLTIFTQILTINSELPGPAQEATTVANYSRDYSRKIKTNIQIHVKRVKDDTHSLTVTTELLLRSVWEGAGDLEIFPDLCKQQTILIVSKYTHTATHRLKPKCS